MKKDAMHMLRHAAADAYGGEEISHRRHALQTAALAVADGADDAMVLAALFHDVGHVLPASYSHAVGEERRHDRLGARFLASLYPPEVSEPVRLHVLAKRYLARDPEYRALLSEESERSLVAQGGVLNDDEAAGMLGIPYAEEALRLRRWCDAAKCTETEVPDLEAYEEISNRLKRAPLGVLNEGP